MSILRINHNVVALNAARNLSATGSLLARSLERLSSGLRINRAADDAAGLSISEKLRSQIRGLDRASANALDGISLIQSAEGALNETGAILQRIRELAVQAANGIYTSNDRIAIQDEVDQLILEIDRIAQTTEFNTRKLLDGTLGALVSTDNPLLLRAAVVGNVGEGGNFMLELRPVVGSGQLQVQKTNVFNTLQTTDAVGQINYLTTYTAHVSLTTANNSGIGNSGLAELVVPPTADGQTILQNGSTSFALLALNNAAGGAAVSTLIQAQELTTGVDTLTFMFSDGSTANVLLDAGGDTLALLAARVSSAITVLYDTFSVGSGSAVLVTASGALSVTTAGLGASLTRISFNDVDESGSKFYVSVGASGADFVTNQFHSSANYEITNTGGTYIGSVGTANALIGGTPFSIGDPTVGALHVRLSTRVAASNVGQSDVLTMHEKEGVNHLQKFGRVWQTAPVARSGSFLISTASNRTYALYSFNNSAYTSLIRSGYDKQMAIEASKGSQIDADPVAAGIQLFSLSETANRRNDIVELTGIKISFDAIFQAGETAVFNVSPNAVVPADQLTTLGSISRFQDMGVFDGRSSVDFKIYLRGSGRYVHVNITPNDTLEDVTGKISLAMYNPSLTSDLNLESAVNLNQPPDIAHVNVLGLARGTISITTPLPGAQVVFSGDEKLLKALGLTEIQSPLSPVYSVSAVNIETGKSTATVRTDSNEIVGLLPGLRLFFDNSQGVVLDPQPPLGGVNSFATFPYVLPTERPELSYSTQTQTQFIHVAPRDFILQIGPNQGQQMRTFIADLSAEAMGVRGILLVSEDLAQEAITAVDEAIARVNGQRSALGAIQNRLEATIRNLDVASENLTASESRIRDADIALETLTATRLQILLQAGTAALAQANQLPQAVLQLLR
jgi:flagellin